MNSKNTRPWLILFLLVSAANLIGNAFSLAALSMITKPGLMLLLAIYFFNSVDKSTQYGFVRTTLWALFFSWLGDILLIFEELFIFGLGAFMFAQVFYIFAYKHAVIEVDNNRSTFIRRLFWSASLLFFGFILYYLMYPNLSGMEIPVAIYCFVIAMMGVMAAQRNGRTVLTSYSLTFFGALLFLTSDTILGLNRFVAPIENGAFYVMLTYLFAQWFIVEGLIKHYRFLQSEDAIRNEN